jgi:hypothetical protein
MLGFVVCRRDAGACGKRQRTGGLIMHQEYTKLYTINPASYRRVSLRKRCYGGLIGGRPAIRYASRCESADSRRESTSSGRA